MVSKPNNAPLTDKSEEGLVVTVDPQTSGN